ncbi:helix-turn-helix transcriptional regulator [Lactobacillus sp. PV037]|uniref:helix-turn-helix domain-containing protein n=1 Tax=unclassified Lactobacillus TaxID=2620435 RepID=UPI00223FD2B9|nr:MULTISPECIES: helix-turn-helix transcriptional regulator [unclassified Lactobacillus]QNQ82199.1 helix-turn-helix transcriptional regulator [Lactobacillus sp. PV012]QNQ83693.1 helix-turn-helix transcriptional regulator [Lactobacillus sp. PV037]
MVKLGAALKNIRLQAGITQQEMCEGVCSVSAYSKIERDIHNIDIDTLCEIFDNNLGVIDVDSFLKIMLSENSKSEESRLLESISQALVLKDKDKFEKIRKEAINKNLSELIKEGLAYAETSFGIAKKWPATPEIKKRIQILYRVENWGGIAVSNLRTLLPFMDSKERVSFIKLVHRTFKGEDLDNDFRTEFLFLLVDYLKILLNDEAPKEDFILPFNIVGEIASPLYDEGHFGYSFIVKKIEAIVTEDKDLYRDIVVIQKAIKMVPEDESESLEDNKYYQKRNLK